MPRTSRPGAALHEFQAVRGGVPLSAPISLTLPPGTVLGLLGPNGVGKSSLLSALAHSGVASRGRFVSGSTDLSQLRPARRAREVSLLPQDLAAPAELRVSELVAVGAHAGGRSDPADAAAAALARAGIGTLADRRFGTLSGGQRQLAHLARVLAQDTPIVLLDEPISALDLAHQQAVADTLRALSASGRIVIAALHDLSFASNACSHVLLLDRAGGAVAGPPVDVLAPEPITRVYGVRTEIHTTPGGRHFIMPVGEHPDGAADTSRA